MAIYLNTPVTMMVINDHYRCVINSWRQPQPQPQPKQTPNQSHNIKNNQRTKSKLFGTIFGSPLLIALNLMIIIPLLMSAFSQITQVQAIVYHNNNNLALMVGTLRTYQASACDQEDLKLECDSRTVVNIIVAQYGQIVPQKYMCRSYAHLRPNATTTATTTTTTTTLAPIINNSRTNMTSLLPYSNNLAKNATISQALMLAAAATNHDDDNVNHVTTLNRYQRDLRTKNASSQPQRCAESKHLRYKFLVKIEEKCREKHDCSVIVDPINFGFIRDPCAYAVKFAEVAYKCRPNTFVNKVVCEGNSVRLHCNNADDRVVIFSAHYGATWNGVQECSSTAISALYPTINSGMDNFSNDNNFTKACQDTYATERAMRLCHNTNDCTISANFETFKMPKCDQRLNYFLKVAYTCTSKRWINTNIRFVELAPPTTTTTTTTTTTNKPRTTASLRTEVNLINDDDDDDGDDDENDEDDQDGHGHHHNRQKPKKVRTKQEGDQRHNGFNQTSINTNTHLMMDSTNGNHLSSRTSWRSRMIPQQHGRVIIIDGEHVINCTDLTDQMQVVGFVSDWISAIVFVRKNQERFILYLLVSLFGSLACFLTVLSARLYYQKTMAVKKIRQEQNLVPHFNFEDDYDDDDNDGADDDDDDDDDADEEEQHENNSPRCPATIDGGDHRVHRKESVVHDSNVRNTSPKKLTMAEGTMAANPQMVGLRDYNVSNRRQSMASYPTVRRPHSGTLLHSQKPKSSSPSNTNHNNNNNHNKPTCSTLGRTKFQHPQHQHHQHQPLYQQQPHHTEHLQVTQPKYSTTTMSQPHVTNSVDYRQSSSASTSTPNTMPKTLPKSILKDSSGSKNDGRNVVPRATTLSLATETSPLTPLTSTGDTAIPMNQVFVSADINKNVGTHLPDNPEMMKMMMMTDTNSQVYTNSSNLNGSNWSFNSNEISSFDFMPPPPSLPSQKQYVLPPQPPPRSITQLSDVGTTFVFEPPSDMLYQVMLRCPKFPVPGQSPTNALTTTTTTTTTTSATTSTNSQHASPSPSASSVHPTQQLSSILEQSSDTTIDQVSLKTMAGTSGIVHLPTETKKLSSSLGNFLV